MARELKALSRVGSLTFFLSLHYKKELCSYSFINLRKGWIHQLDCSKHVCEPESTWCPVFSLRKWKHVQAASTVSTHWLISTLSQPLSRFHLDLGVLKMNLGTKLAPCRVTKGRINKQPTDSICHETKFNPSFTKSTLHRERAMHQTNQGELRPTGTGRLIVSRMGTRLFSRIALLSSATPRCRNSSRHIK